MAGGKKSGPPNKQRSVLRSLAYFLLWLGLTIGFVWWVTRPEKETERRASWKPPLGGRPKLALIIDDGGYQLSVIQEMLALRKPLTFAILPYSPRGVEAARLIHQHGAQVMLHLPMEPKEGNSAPWEVDTIQVGMSPTKVQRILRQGLKQIPHVRGVNNHMGSKATEDAVIMHAVMEVLKREGLYFIDSRTSSESVGEETARKAGVPFGRNGQFLDRGKNMAAIEEAIRLAMAKAKKEGRAVAIGHPQPLLAQAIRKMIPEIENEGIRLVLASEVVQ